MKRRATNKWQAGYGKRGNLSYPKMMNAVYRRHPRSFVEGETKLIPMWRGTGDLVTSACNNYRFVFDDFGLGVSIYFKLLKGLIVFFIICGICVVPLCFVYQNGDTSE